MRGGAFPIRSDVTNVVAEATGLEVAALAQDTVRVARGTPGVTLLRFRLDNPGVSGISSSVRCTSLAVALTDSAGAMSGTPGNRVRALRLVAGSQILAARTVAPADPDTLSIVFEPPPRDRRQRAARRGARRRHHAVGTLRALRGAPARLDAGRRARREHARRGARVVTPATLRGGSVTVEAPAETPSCPSRLPCRRRS